MYYIYEVEGAYRKLQEARREGAALAREVQGRLGAERDAARRERDTAREERDAARGEVAWRREACHRMWEKCC